MIGETDEQHGCVELIRYVQATDKERKDPGYIPKLEMNEQAQAIISERFQAPISIIAYVGKVGVGKSKLAGLTVETLHKRPSDQKLRPFLRLFGTLQRNRTRCWPIGKCRKQK